MENNLKLFFVSLSLGFVLVFSFTVSAWSTNSVTYNGRNYTVATVALSSGTTYYGNTSYAYINRNSPAYSVDSNVRAITYINYRGTISTIKSSVGKYEATAQESETHRR